ncbi:MAG: endolytic transglycosylase MltG [Janthinobacterium lividum]
MRVLKLLLFVLVVAVAALGYTVLVPFGPTQATFIDIPTHTGTVGIASALERGGAIRNRWTFAALREIEGGTLKAGEYRFAEPVSMLEVYARLRRGDVFTVAVVIPEGYDLFDIAAAIEAAGLATRGEFLAAASTNTALIRQWNPNAASLEGYLFPDTYRFSRHATSAIMLGAMTRRFGQMAIRLGLTGPEVPQLVTMASLVEREVHLDAERPVVAGVFENRLRLRMPLQTDPAVVYASMLRGTWTGVIHMSELRSDSPYNTYAHQGLPPGPICNPGVAALRAAMHPAKTEYLYFVANADGTTKFATSLAEHNANVTAYRAAGPQ